MCDRTCWYVWCDPWPYDIAKETYLLMKRDLGNKTYSYMKRDLEKRHKCVQREGVTWRDVLLCAIWPSAICDMTHWCVWQSSLCVAWPIKSLELTVETHIRLQETHIHLKETQFYLCKTHITPKKRMSIYRDPYPVKRNLRRPNSIL